MTINAIGRRMMIILNGRKLISLKINEQNSVPFFLYIRISSSFEADEYLCVGAIELPRDVEVPRF